MKPALVELAPGYGVKCTQRQIDEVEATCDAPTKMIRKLMNVFFTEETLAQSSCYGSRGKQDQLDGDVVAACISKQGIYV